MPLHFIEHNFLVGRTFADLADLNAQARAFCDTVNATPKRHLHASPRELFAAEQSRLRPLPLFVPEVYALHHRLVDVEGWRDPCAPRAPESRAPARRASRGANRTCDRYLLSHNYATTPLQELSVPTRAYNALRREGIVTIGDLLSTSTEELLMIPRLGTKCVLDVQSALAKYKIPLPSDSVLDQKRNSR